MVNRDAMNQLSRYPHLNRYISNLKSIPGGPFYWGASRANNKSGFPITISTFRMGATPVTWGMWKEYCKAESVRMPLKPHWGYLDNHPVVNVSWEDIMGGFCEWASGVAGFKLTLPTDAQWEYAVRDGKGWLEYPWGDDFDESKLWCSTIQSGGPLQTAAVDRKIRIHRNGYDLTDMGGNVWQWCADYYNEDYHPTGKDPEDRRQSKLRCARGGSWRIQDLEHYRCTFRLKLFPHNGGDIIGFRLSAGPK